MTLTDLNHAWLLRRAAQAAPQEACGFILSTGEIVEIRNVSPNPERAFHMDRQQLVQKLGHRMDSIAGIWHTHPGGTVHPSATDLHAIKIGAIQPHWKYWIVTASAVTAYDTGLYVPRTEQFWADFAS